MTTDEMDTLSPQQLAREILNSIRARAEVGYIADLIYCGVEMRIKIGGENTLMERAIEIGGRTLLDKAMVKAEEKEAEVLESRKKETIRWASCE